jgi:hypothetical protein
MNKSHTPLNHRHSCHPEIFRSRYCDKGNCSGTVHAASCCWHLPYDGLHDRGSSSGQFVDDRFRYNFRSPRFCWHIEASRRQLHHRHRNYSLRKISPGFETRSDNLRRRWLRKFPDVTEIVSRTSRIGSIESHSEPGSEDRSIHSNQIECRLLEHPRHEMEEKHPK